MLLLRTAAQIRTNRHRKNQSDCRTSTGAPRLDWQSGRVSGEYSALANRELRRLWLNDRWSEHLRRVSQAGGVR